MNLTDQHSRQFFYLSCCLLSLLCLVLSGCGGVTSDSVERSDSWVGNSENRKPVQIMKVINSTGREEYDAVRHFVHLKTGQILNETGNYSVVADDILESMPELVTGEPVAAEYLLVITLKEVREQNGGTVSFAILSGQGKNVMVTVLAELSRPDGTQVGSATGKGKSSKGAWGVVAKVNREAMLSKKGFWEVDNSMLGIAAARALEKALAQL